MRAAVFLNAAFRRVIGDIYGCTPIDLPLDFRGSPIGAYRIERAWKRQLTFAPYNFQPVLRDLNSCIMRALVKYADECGPRWSVQARLHHALPRELVDELQLSCTQQSVESLVTLKDGFEKVLSRMQPRQRSKWRKASKSGLCVREFRDEGSLRDFHRLMVRVYRDKHRMLAQPYELFARLLAIPPGTRSVRAYSAYDARDSEFLGAIIVIIDEVQWCYAWGATDQTGRHADLSTLLIGQAMQDAVAAGAQVFSLGVSPLSHARLRQFKRNWGGEEHPILAYHWREKPEEVDLHAGFGLAKAVIARCPASLLAAASRTAVRWLA